MASQQMLDAILITKNPHMMDQLETVTKEDNASFSELESEYDEFTCPVLQLIVKIINIYPVCISYAFNMLSAFIGDIAQLQGSRLCIFFSLT